MAGPWTGEVQITVLDGAAGVVSVPSSKVQAIMGCAIAGTNYQVIPTASLATISSTFTGGMMPEAAGLAIQAGGVVYAVKLPSATAGVLDGITAVSGGVTGATVANPCVITVGSTTTTLLTGDVVVIASVGGTTTANGTWPITVINATTFSIPTAGVGAYTSGGTVTPTGSVATRGALSTGTMYFSGVPNIECYPMAVVQTGFTAGTVGGTVLLSLDRGATFGPPIAIGAGLTLALKDVGGFDSGLTLNVQTGLVYTGGGIVNGVPVGDYCRAHAKAPQPNDAGIATGLAALVAYLASSAGTFPVVQIVGDMASGDVASIESGGSTNLDSMASQYLFERAIVHTRDAKAPAAWGGQAAETAAVWKAAVILDLSATTAKRVTATGGWYNMPSAFPTAFASVPKYRFPLSMALGARRVSVDPQRMASKVGLIQGGNIAQVIINPTTDPSDGFVYNDENLNPGFDYTLPGGVARIAAARSHFRKAGLFFTNDLLLAPQGSDFTFLARGLVMDVACSITHDTLVDFVASDFVTKFNGTLSDSAANTIRGKVYDAIKSNMQDIGMISGFSIVVDQSQNLQVTQTLKVIITILGVAYVLEADVTLSYANALAAAAA